MLHTVPTALPPPVGHELLQGVPKLGVGGFLPNVVVATAATDLIQPGAPAATGSGCRHRVGTSGKVLTFVLPLHCLFLFVHA